MELRGSCGMCGKCCEAIHIPISPEELKKRYEGWPYEDVKFVYENWNPITQEQAFEINPHLKRNFEFAQQRDNEGHKKVLSEMHYYTCSKHDKITKLCTVHDTRPHVCSGYPWYGNRPWITELFYSDDCGYIIDREDEKARQEAEKEAVRSEDSNVG